VDVTPEFLEAIGLLALTTAHLENQLVFILSGVKWKPGEVGFQQLARKPLDQLLNELESMSKAYGTKAYWANLPIDEVRQIGRHRNLILHGRNYMPRSGAQGDPEVMCFFWMRNDRPNRELKLQPDGTQKEQECAVEFSVDDIWRLARRVAEICNKLVRESYEYKNDPTSGYVPDEKETAFWLAVEALDARATAGTSAPTAAVAPVLQPVSAAPEE